MKPYALNVNDLNSTEEPSAQWTRRAVGLSLLGTLAACGSSTNTVISSGTSSSSGPVVSTFAGSGVVGSADGAGILASFRDPTGVAVDSNGNVYVAEPWNCLIRKISPSGVVTTLAGVGSTSGHTDGNGPQALFSGPSGLAVDSSGTVYVADTWNNLIRKITPGGEVTTWAGSVQGYADGTGANASFFGPSGLAVDSNGNVYVADAWNHLIRKITPSGVVTTLAGTARVGGYEDGIGTQASFSGPTGLAIDRSGNLYVADPGNHVIRKITL